MKYYLILFLTISFSFNVSPQEKAKWIWYPGDFEIWLHTEVSTRRQERSQPYPPFWRVDSPYGVIRFEKSYNITAPDTIQIYCDGKYQIRLNGEIQYEFDPNSFVLPAGKNTISFLVENFESFPSLLIKGNAVFTDHSWKTTNQDQEWYNADAGKFTNPLQPPSTFSLNYSPIPAKVIQKEKNRMLVDFGKETFGKVLVENLKGHGKIILYYGETKQEALAEKQAETYDIIKVERDLPLVDTTESRAFRYIYAVSDNNIVFDKISALYEYLPLTQKGSFQCSDSLLNKIYEVSLYTLHLNTREFHLDGIKRDRWIWSGDAYQSYLMNFYSFFDEDVNKRTLYALRGHDPVATHINTILDYSFYWKIGIYDHYLYTGDTAFVRQIYPRMKTLMDFCLGRTNQNGFVEGLPGDWVFIDWADMDKSGEISFQQLLLARSLEATALSATIANDLEYAKKCRILSENIKKKVVDVFWSNKKNAFVHNRKDGILSETVTRYANMFAILFDYADAEMKQEIRDSVILNDNIQKITTPYMKFYELASLCEIGEQKQAIDFVKDYWGGMLKLGATSIWEAYDPEQKGDEHYAMYGRPFGKSLCHAWGANPVYLFGKYLLGVKPTSPGYSSYVIEPSLGGLEWIKGKVPTPYGDIEIFMDAKTITVKTDKGEGILLVKSKKSPKVEKGVVCTQKDENLYEIQLDIPNKEYSVKYFL